jgi:hypothetical protein
MACEPTQSDDALYRSAFTASATNASALCLAIDNPALQGGCVAELAAAEANPGWCDELPASQWRDECHFLVADSRELVGDAAVTACGRAGVWTQPCASHALIREMTDELTAAGDEPSWLGRIDRRIDQRYPELLDDKRTMASGVAAAVLAARWSNRPFDVAECGMAGFRLCVRAYDELLRIHAGEFDTVAVCAGPITAASARALGAPSWTPASRHLVLPAWEQRCREVIMSGGPMR